MTTSPPRRPDDAPAAAPPAAAGAAAGPPALLERRVLDEQVAAAAGQPWGVLSWLGPVLVLVVLLGAAGLVAALLPEHGTGRSVGAAVLNLGLYALLVLALVVFGRPVVARDGWRGALGLDRVRRSDWLPWITGVGFAYAGRTVIAGLAVALTGGRALAEATNVSAGDRSVGTVVVLALVAVVLAPVTEEVLFRGLVLRGFMRRLRFWPAAVLSTLLFAGFHAAQVDTLAGSVVLVASVAVLGLVNCYLVRITGRLTPGIMVHATYNALAVAYVVVTG